jgi:hypothetical protein
MAGAFLLFANLFLSPGDIIAAQNGDCETLCVDGSAINWVNRPTFLYPNIYSGYLKIERPELVVFEKKWILSAWKLLTTDFLSLEDPPSSGISRLAGPLTESGMIFGAREIRLVDPDNPPIRGFIDLDGSLVPSAIYFEAGGRYR